MSIAGSLVGCAFITRPDLALTDDLAVRAPRVSHRGSVVAEANAGSRVDPRSSPEVPRDLLGSELAQRLPSVSIETVGGTRHLLAHGFCRKPHKHYKSLAQKPLNAKWALLAVTPEGAHLAIGPFMF